jgi:DNA-binding transcriptional LysR family regulator
MTLQQLRSLCETGRLGSFWAAAKALEVSHPTVWKQVHALERQFGLPLMATHRYGCQLTVAGRLLIAMAENSGGRRMWRHVASTSIARQRFCWKPLKEKCLR